MFSNTAYEAFYTYIGLFLHEASIKLITSQGIFLSLIVIIFAVCLFLAASQFLSRYMPGVLVKKRTVPLSIFFKLVLCLFIGISLLKIGTDTDVKKFDRTSWHTNHYIEVKLPDLNGSFEVSFIFDILSRSAEETARFFSIIVDKLFDSGNSETSAPSFFYKSIMYAGADTIDDPQLRDKINFYVDECFGKVIPLINEEKAKGNVDKMFKMYPEVDAALAEIPIETEGTEKITCLSLKNEVVAHLQTYAESKAGNIPRQHYGSRVDFLKNPTVHRNYYASRALVRYFWQQKETYTGIQKGAEAIDGPGGFFQTWSRIWSFDGILHILGLEKYEGASLYAERIQKFSEYLKRAPHLAGIIKMILIFLFPWLVFFLAAGKWRPLMFWYVVYFSVVMWAPIWCLFYHIMTSIALSTEVMAHFGELSDGISLYSSELISSRLYQFYAVYAWIQLLSGPMLTGFVAIKFFPWIRDNQEESAPELVRDAASVGGVVASSTLGGPAGTAASMGISKVKNS